MTYADHLHACLAICDVIHTPAELEAIVADQAQRVADMRLAERGGTRYDLFARNGPVVAVG